MTSTARDQVHRVPIAAKLRIPGLEDVNGDVLKGSMETEARQSCRGRHGEERERARFRVAFGCSGGAACEAGGPAERSRGPCSRVIRVQLAVGVMRADRRESTEHRGGIGLNSEGATMRRLGGGREEERVTRRGGKLGGGGASKAMAGLAAAGSSPSPNAVAWPRAPRPAPQLDAPRSPPACPLPASRPPAGSRSGTSVRFVFVPRSRAARRLHPGPSRLSWVRVSGEEGLSPLSIRRGFEVGGRRQLSTCVSPRRRELLRSSFGRRLPSIRRVPSAASGARYVFLSEGRAAHGWQQPSPGAAETCPGAGSLRSPAGPAAARAAPTAGGWRARSTRRRDVQTRAPRCVGVRLLGSPCPPRSLLTPARAVGGGVFSVGRRPRGDPGAPLAQ